MGNRVEQERGFTLLEVIVALMIAGIALAAMMGALSTGLSGEGRAVDQLQALSLARSELDAEMMLPRLTPGERKVTLMRGFQSTIETRQVARGHAAGGRVLALYQVNIRVEWGATGHGVVLSERLVRDAVEAP
ncbi:type IV pilus modification PilV family protein [Neokomagataea anthophila]|uniref:Type II secretion system protein n=1 Tax=Neokomagataea anthophila TaxID=2826925 RepID=A0ABS5E9K8_9PROT|nr:type II secretion system protein [Neokomagataea anthophila]MBR0560594.1 type II secretion system protein [Neokomagataea anthophila]